VDPLVEEAAKHADEDKATMARIEARNELESYLYNARNSLQDDKVKEKLGEEGAAGLKVVEEGLAWLEENGDSTGEEFKEKMKEYETKIRPVMMKLYAETSGTPSYDGAAEGGMPGMHGMPSAPAPGPKVEEVD
jgi:L1 cell adhesion molecule like protein